MLVVLLAVIAPVTAHAAFGLKETDVTFTGLDGSPATQAGSHPFAFTTKLAVNTEEKDGEEVPDQEAKDIKVALPPGLVGTPTAVPRCSATDFLTFPQPACSDSTAVGFARVEFGEPGIVERYPVYNLVPATGVAAKIGFLVEGRVPVTINVGVNPNPPHNLISTAVNTSQALLFYSIKLTIWGVPADPAHDAERGRCTGAAGQSCPVNIPQVPFLTLPTRCEGPLLTGFEADSWEDPGVWTQPILAETHDGSSPPNSLGMTGCDGLGFDPTIVSRPTSEAAQSPTGLDFSLNVADEGLTSPTGIAKSDIKKAVVTLPEGMTANPSLAEGLNVCSEEDLTRETVNSEPGEGCPTNQRSGRSKSKRHCLKNR